MVFVNSTGTLKLNTGAEIPQIGLGGWAGISPEERFAARDWMLAGLKAGYRHIDTAVIYGTEASVGDAIRRSGIPRSEIYVTSKLPWNGHGRVREVFEKSLKDLDIDYIDLYLMHWPVAVVYQEGNDFPTNPDGTTPVLHDVSFNDIYADLEKLLETGKVKAIGVSNLSIKTLNQLLETAKVVPAVNQVELHPYRAQDELVQYCKSKGIVVEAYTPSGRDVVRKDPVIVELAAKYKVSPTQIILAWHITRGVVILPGSTNVERQKENMKLPILAEEDVKKINALDRFESMIYRPFEVKGTLWGWPLERYGW
ncbi:Aldo/keto reductase [Hymenopellis radicata]|nr:Aldo/keto reductase [Hymenopellis radicata]